MTFIVVFYLLSVLGTHIGLYYFFKKNGIPAWKAFVPFLNKIEWIKMVGQKPSFLVWFFIPGANVIAAISLMSELLDAHRIYGFKEHYGGIFCSAVYFPHLFIKQNPTYFGPKGEIAGERFKKPKPTIFREWTDTIVFAVSAAMLIRTFFFENYTIPTSSLEGTLLVGDFLIVDKITYGIRLPNTPLSFPLVHNTMPLTENKVNSYVEWLTIPYIRMPKIRGIHRNDIVVFNYPEGDTVTAEYQSQIMYTELCARKGREAIHSEFQIESRPVDKRDNYVKRCVAIPGDKLEVKQGRLYINNALAYQAKKLQTSFKLGLNLQKMVNTNEIYNDLLALDVNVDEYNLIQAATDTFIVHTDFETIQKIKQIKYIASATEMIYPAPDMENFMFPHDKSQYQWSVDNYGPITIPQKGITVALTPQNISMYERIIGIYEGNRLEQREGKFYINGNEATSYTFKMDYYFMMGDNRHNSQDSRAWGFVPEDHIVGRPLMIFMSWNQLKNTIRWDRLLNWVPSKFTPNSTF
jgi:signal peptidase I